MVGWWGGGVVGGGGRWLVGCWVMNSNDRGIGTLVSFNDPIYPLNITLNSTPTLPRTVEVLAFINLDLG